MRPAPLRCAPWHGSGPPRSHRGTRCKPASFTPAGDRSTKPDRRPGASVREPRGRGLPADPVRRPRVGRSPTPGYPPLVRGGRSIASKQHVTPPTPRQILTSGWPPVRLGVDLATAGAAWWLQGAPRSPLAGSAADPSFVGCVHPWRPHGSSLLGWFPFGHHGAAEPAFPARGLLGGAPWPVFH
jgi:hypothetical protein